MVKSSCQEEEEEEEQEAKVEVSRSILRTCYRNSVATQVKTSPAIWAKPASRSEQNTKQKYKKAIHAMAHCAKSTKVLDDNHNSS